MRQYKMMELREAVEYAEEGGQALHLHTIIGNRSKAPKCFVRAVDKGENIAHLFDQNKSRLIATAKKVGVPSRMVLVEREGTPHQHIDLCGTPLKNAIKLCDNPDSVIEGFDI